MNNINYFDTPTERRKGNHFIINLVQSVLNERKNKKRDLSHMQEINKIKPIKIQSIQK